MGEKAPLNTYLSQLSAAGSYRLRLRARPKQRARTAILEVRFGGLSMPIPRQTSPYVETLKPQPIEQHVVWVREINPPNGRDPIEWVLYASLAVNTFEDALIIIAYYECRWLIEEFHKALKSECSEQRRILREANRLETVVGLTSVVAVRLLQLKSVAASEPERPARTVVPPIWLEMLKASRKNYRCGDDLTVREFYREIAKLGCFLGRRSDGVPGWITIWRGWEKLNARIQGAERIMKLRKCG